MTLVDDEVEVTLLMSRAALARAWEIVSERDWDMRRDYGLEDGMTVEEYLAALLEEKLR